MAVLVAADFDADEWARWWPLLQAAMPHETLWRDAAAAPPGSVDVALVANPPPGALRGLPNLRLVQSLWAGVDRLLDDPTVPAGVPLARMVDPAMNDAMAQTAAWAVTSLQRGFFEYAAQQRAGRWQPRAWQAPGDFTVAVLGLGQMGRATARRLLRDGHHVIGWRRGGMAVDGVGAGVGRGAGAVEGVAAVDGLEREIDLGLDFANGIDALDAVLERAHVVVNLLPLTLATHGLFEARRLARMRVGASLVNLARGAHVVEADLLDALDRGHLQRAVLDVFATEPLPAGHRFWSHPAVTVLPHVAAPTDPRSAVQVVAANVEALRHGWPLQHLVERGRGY